jgi:hypothetical protein
MRLLERERPKVVAVALANKTARIAWRCSCEWLCRAGGLRANHSIELATEDRVGVLRGDDEPVVSGDRENQGVKAPKRARNFDWDPIRGLHHGRSASNTLAIKGRRHDCKRPVPGLLWSKSPASGDPSCLNRTRSPGCSVKQDMQSALPISEY